MRMVEVKVRAHTLRSRFGFFRCVIDSVGRKTLTLHIDGLKIICAASVTGWLAAAVWHMLFGTVWITGAID